MGGRRGVWSVQLVVLTLLPAFASPASAALSGPRSLQDRVLEANCVFVARLTLDAEPKRFGGALYRLEVKEILEAPKGLTDFEGYLLNDIIPGASAMGRRIDVPTDVDALVFANLHVGKRLGGIRWCTNWVVPLRGTLEESTAPEGKWEKLSPAEFLKRVRSHLKEMRDPDHLLKAFRGAQGSMRPYSWHDKPPLLGRLLALEDERVLPMARALAAENTDTRLQGMLDRYLAQHDADAQRERLRARFDALLADHAAGRLEGTEQFVFPSGSMHTKRPRVERILDAAGPLRTAGDKEYVRQRLLALHRAGHGFVDAYLLRLGERAVFVDLLKKAHAWDGSLKKGKPDSAAFRSLLGTRDRFAVLATIRVAFLQTSAAATRAVLESIRSTLSMGPGVRVEPGSVTRRALDKLSIGELRTAWRAWWRESASSLRTVFHREAIDEVLGKDPTWAARD